MNHAPEPTADNSTLNVYGSTASYYTGKLEAYLRAKGITYELIPFSEPNLRRCAKHTGVMQIPQVERADGSWLIDTTLIIEYYELERPQPAVSPADPALRFVSRLIEDYADEWLWRPAMHYRWSYPETARLMSSWLAEHLADKIAPQAMKRLWWKRRQFGGFVKGDGVTRHTRAAVEASYLDTLAALEGIFAKRPFVLGQRPAEADFGLFASMFRHFSCDPAPARIMREQAPSVYEWVARMWNLNPEKLSSQPMPERLPDDLGAIFRAITEIYLPYLDANAEAYAQGNKRVTYQVQGVAFTEPTKPYRVWCRDRLHHEFMALAPDARAAVEKVLNSDEAVQRLTTPSAQPAPDLVGSLPITSPAKSKEVDSWWRK